MEPVLSYPSLAVLPLHFPSIHTPMADPLTGACLEIWRGPGFWSQLPCVLAVGCELGPLTHPLPYLHILNCRGLPTSDRLMVRDALMAAIH